MRGRPPHESYTSLRSTWVIVLVSAAAATAASIAAAQAVVAQAEPAAAAPLPPPNSVGIPACSVQPATDGSGDLMLNAHECELGPGALIESSMDADIRGTVNTASADGVLGTLVRNGGGWKNSTLVAVKGQDIKLTLEDITCAPCIATDATTLQQLLTSSMLVQRVVPGASVADLAMRNVAIVGLGIEPQRSAALFQGLMASQSVKEELAANPLAIYTDNTTFIYIAGLSAFRGIAANSVGVFSAERLGPPQIPGAPHSGFLGGNFELVVTNDTLVPLLINRGGINTPAPLLLLLTRNCTLSPHPALPPDGINIRRPVYILGARTAAPTGIDFGGMVNTLVLSGHGELTFDNLYLENLGPGDLESVRNVSGLSATLGFVIWAVKWDRTDARLTIVRCTMVVADHSQIEKLRFYTSIFHSTEPKLRAESEWLRTGAKVTDIQLALDSRPGITFKLYARQDGVYHDVFLTESTTIFPKVRVQSRIAAAEALVADAANLLQVPPVSAGMWGPEDLMKRLPPVRPLVLLLVPPNGADIAPKPEIGWPPPGGARFVLVTGNVATTFAIVGGVGQPANGSDPRMPMGLDDCSPLLLGYGRDMLAMLDRGIQLRLRGLVLSKLAQGEGADKATSQLDPSVWTLLMWAVSRPLDNTNQVLLQSSWLVIPAHEHRRLSTLIDTSKDGNVDIPLSGGVPISIKGGFAAAGGVLVLPHFTAPGIEGRQVALLSEDTAPASVGLRAINTTNATGGATKAAAGGTDQQQQQQLVRPPYFWPEKTGMEKASLPRWVYGVIGGGLGGAGLAVAAALGRRVARKRRRSELHAVLTHGLTPSSSLGVKSGDGSHINSPHSGGGLGGRSGPGSPGGAMAATAGSGGLDERGAADGGSGGDSGDRWQFLTQRIGKRIARIHMQQLAVYSNDQAGDGDWQADSGVNASTGTGGGGGSTPGNAAIADGGSGAAPAAGGPVGRASSSGGLDASAGGPGMPGAGGMPTISGSQQQGGGGGPPGDMSAKWLDQNLRLIEPIGHGSFGTVFRGILQDHTEVAVKLMQLPELSSPEKGRGPSTRERMVVQEAAIAAAMAHPHVVTVFSVGLRPCHVQSGGGPGLPGLPGGPQGANDGESSSPADASRSSSMARAGGGGGGASGSGNGATKPVLWSLQIVMEYCDQGTLRQALDAGRLKNPLTGRTHLPTALSLARDIASALQYLHLHQIIHGDLKASNVMLKTALAPTVRRPGSLVPASSMGSGHSTNSGGSDEGGSGGRGGLSAPVPRLRGELVGTDGQSPDASANLIRGGWVVAKICDFGLSTFIDPACRSTTMSQVGGGTLTHMAPETLVSGRASKASDVYAFGIVLYELLTGERPYSDIPQPLLGHAVITAHARPKWPAGLGGQEYVAAKTLAEACWQHNPQARPSFKEIVQRLQQLIVSAAGGSTSPGSSSGGVSSPGSGGSGGGAGITVGAALAAAWPAVAARGGGGAVSPPPPPRGAPSPPGATAAAPGGGVRGGGGNMPVPFHVRGGVIVLGEAGPGASGAAEGGVGPSASATSEPFGDLSPRAFGDDDA